MSNTEHLTPADALQTQVTEKYGELARGVLDAHDTGGCGGPTTCAPEGNPVTSDLYTHGQAGAIPVDAMIASLGCGNPTALIELEEGQVVLDLGSGGGIDVLLSADRVGATGQAYGLDLTDDMLELARKNQREAGVENVEFLKGSIEDVPLPDESVDVIISNCVINLALDKSSVFREACRVLRPGGRFAVSDIVIRGDIDPEVRRSVEAWIGCVAGALEEGEFRSGLQAAGFVDVEIEPTRVYTYEDARPFLEEAGLDLEAARSTDGSVISAFIRATKR